MLDLIKFVEIWVFLNNSANFDNFIIFKILTILKKCDFSKNIIINPTLSKSHNIFLNFKNIQYKTHFYKEWKNNKTNLLSTNVLQISQERHIMIFYSKRFVLMISKENGLFSSFTHWISHLCVQLKSKLLTKWAMTSTKSTVNSLVAL